MRTGFARDQALLTMEALAMSVVIGVVGCRVVMSARIGLSVTGIKSGFTVRLGIVTL